MKSKNLELVLSKFLENETKQFTSKEFKTVFFELCGNELSIPYLENLANSNLRLLKTVNCVKVISKGTITTYELNLIQIKKVFPFFKDFDFSNKEKEKGVKK